MSDYKKTNDPKDPFSKYFRQRLINKPTYPDENCWDEIEARLPKRRAISPVWFGLAIAASVIAAVFILNNTTTKKGQLAYNEAIVSEKREDSISQPTEEDVSVSSSIEEEKPVTLQAKFVEEDKAHTQKEAGEDMKDTAGDENLKVEQIIEQVSDTEETKKNTEQTEQDEKVRKDGFPLPDDIDELKYQGNKNLISYDNDRKHRSGNSKKWLMFTGLGSAGSGLGYLISSLGSSMKDYDIMSPPPPGNEVETPPGLDENGDGNKDFEKNPTEEIAETSHSMPITFGLTVRKKINKTIGVETGLLYTYLSSDFKIDGSDYSEAKLSLYYIGIPLNLTVNLLDKKSWNIYIAGGGMVEKGLRSVYRKKDSKEKNNISGLQWSLNGGVGFSYSFYKYMNLYIEPGFSYYFDCNQPVSRRTDDPFGFNLRAGLRYDF